MGDPSFSAAPSPLLRPLGFGELFDRAITLYVRNFWPFVAITLVYVIPIAVVVQLFSTAPAGSATRSVVGLVEIAILLVLAPVSWGATARGVAAAYARERVSFRACYGAAIRYWLRLVGLMCLTIWAVASLAAGYVVSEKLFDTLVAEYGVLLVPFLWTLLPLLAALGILCMPSMACDFAFCAVVLERRTVFAAIGGGFARVFGAGEFWRGFGVAVCLTAIQIAVEVIRGREIAMASSVHQPWLGSMLSALVNAVVNPFSMILLVVYYYDVRVRREGLDLELRLRAPEAVEQSA